MTDERKTDWTPGAAYTGRRPEIEWRTFQARRAAEKRAEKRRKMLINALALIGAAMMTALIGAIWISLLDRASLGGM